MFLLFFDGVEKTYASFIYCIHGHLYLGHSTRMCIGHRDSGWNRALPMFHWGTVASTEKSMNLGDKRPFLYHKANVTCMVCTILGDMLHLSGLLDVTTYPCISA